MTIQHNAGEEPDATSPLDEECTVSRLVKITMPFMSLKEYLLLSTRDLLQLTRTAVLVVLLSLNFSKCRGRLQNIQDPHALTISDCG